MSIFHKKFSVRKNSAGKTSVPVFDPERQRPVIYSSICTGEKRAGFEDKKTGRFEEIMLICSQKDMEEFCRVCGLKEADIPVRY